MRIPILAKIFFLILIILTGSLAAVLYSTQNIFKKDKALFVEELSAKLSGGIVNAMSVKAENIESKLAIFVSNYQSLTPAQKADPKLSEFLFQQYPEFLAIGMMERRASEWHGLWSVKNTSSMAVNWPTNYEFSLFKQLNTTELQTGNIWIFRQSTPENKSVFTAFFKVDVKQESFVKQYIVAGILRLNSFDSIVKDYKEALNEGFIIDQSGTSIAYPKRNFVGVSLKNHPVVQSIVRTKKIAGKGDRLANLEGEEVVYSFKTIPRTNLYAVLTTPKAEAFQAANELVLNLIIIGAAVAIISLMLLLVFTRLITNPLNKLRKVAAQIGDGNFHIPVDVKSSDEVGDLSKSIKQMLQGLIERDEALDHSKKALIQSEKMSAFGQLSAGIAHEVKNPLAGILGHAQLAKGKAQNEDMRKHIQFIEKETKRTKEIIENLMKFARQEKLELEPTNLYETVSVSVDLVDHQLSLMNVKIHKHLQDVGPILGQSNQIQQVLLNLMMNAGHAMENSDEKRLDVYLEQINENTAQVRIKDTGTGMPKEVQDRIFEPFFTTKPSGKGTGLGLSVSVGIVEDHNAKIYIESEEGKGTCFFIDFPTNKEVIKPKADFDIDMEPEEDNVLERADAVLREDLQKADRGEKIDLEGDPLTSKEVTSGVEEMPSSPEENIESIVPKTTESKVDLPSSRDYLQKEKGIENIKPRHKMEASKERKEQTASNFKVKIRKPKTK